MISTSPGPRIAFADTLRGIAASCVLVHHFFYTFWRKPQIVADLIVYPAAIQLIEHAEGPRVPDFGLADFWGHFGVALFFLISGFVIPFSVEALSRFGFAIARILRIWPTYVVGLSITLICVAANAASAHVAFPFGTWDVLSHYLILPRWPTLARPLDGIIWTLEIEFAFYFFCAVMSNHLRNFDGSIFLWALLSVPIGYAASAAMNTLLAWSVPAFALAHWASSMAQFIAYMLVGTAFYYFFRSKISLRKLALVHALLLLAFIASWRLGVMSLQGWSGPISYLIAYAAFAAAYAARGIFSRFPSRLSRLFSLLADISYPLYVVHAILGYSILAHAIEAGAEPVLAVLLALLVVLVAATILHRVVEVPSRTVGKLLAKRYG